MKQTKHKFNEMDEILHIFKLDPTTGLISHYEVTNYNIEQVSKYTHRKLYVFREALGALHSTLYTIDEKNLDQFKNNKVVSFSNSEEHARCVMINALEQRQNELEKKQQATGAILAAIMGANYVRPEIFT